MKEDLIFFFEKALYKGLKKDIKVEAYSLHSGGCINQAARLNTSAGSYFIKWNSAKWNKMFSLEYAGLQLLKETDTVAIPEVYGKDSIADYSFLILEHIESKTADPIFWEHFGNIMADLHRNKEDYFGLNYDNFIGILNQKNTFSNSWVQFFIENRLDPQIELAYKNNLISTSFLKKFKNIYIKLPLILPEEQPSLLHGDLWSGNFISGKDGKAYLIDPAVYYGNREAEIAYTKLFGGFSPPFYASYHDNFPLQPNFEERVEIYNLYHLLVHVNLFGTSYLSSVISTVDSIQ